MLDPGMRWFSLVLGIVLAFVLVRIVWIYVKRNEPPIPAKMERIVGIPKELDTKDLKILSFYSPTAAPVRGEPFVICYGVLNAASVALDPPLAEISPAITRCVSAKVEKKTQVTLTATGKNGETASASFTLGVSEPRPEFKFVSISSRQIKRGEKFTLCYGVKNATKVKLHPGGPMLLPGERLCFQWFPMTTPLRLIAESPGGREEIALPVRIVK
jgi:hypothetical protein